MEVKEGYKNTEVGVIPEDWEVKCIGDFCELTSSKRIFEHDYVSVGVPFYRGKEISMLLENKPITEPYYIAESKYESIRRRWGAPMKGEILITAVGTLCNVYLIPNDEKFYFKDGNLIWLRNISRVDFRFLVYQIDNFKKEIIDKAIGSSQKALTMVVLKKQLIPLPLTLSEQTAIATVLSDTDNLIQALEKKIAKKELIKKGAMQQLLEPKEGWEVKRLGEIAKVNMGQSPLSEFYNTQKKGLPLIQGNADIKDRKTIIRYYTSSVTKRGKTGDVIMSVRAPVGEVAKAMFDCCLGRGVCSILYDNDYIYQYLIYIENSWAKLSKGSTFDSVNSKQVKELEIPIPISKSKQTHIAQILSDMDTEIESLQEKLSKYKQLKQGLMQELLTGRIRLV